MITPANFNILVSNVNLLLGQAWAQGVPSVYQTYCLPVPSSNLQEVYFWTGRLPKMRLWTGARVVFQSALESYTLPNQLFEATLSIDRLTLDDGAGAAYYRQLPDMADQAMRQPDYMFRDLLENSGDQTGTRQLGLDGLTGFNTAHPVDIYNASAGTYSNDATGGGFVATLPKAGGGTTNITIGGAFSPNAFMSLYEYMMGIKGQDGESLGVVPDKLLISQYLKGEADLVLMSQFFAPPAWGTVTGQVGAAESPTKKFGVTADINPLFTQPYTWYLADTSRKGAKPFIHQRREATSMVPRTNPQDPAVFDNHTFLYGMWDRQAVGWGPSFLVARSGPA
jgi:phage major head subunit gpT-like protein